MLATVIGRLRLIAIIEGISYICLLFIAMPIRAIWNIKEAVSIVGAIHGGLFLLFCLALLLAWKQYRWSFGRAVAVFISSLIPFATFIMDRFLKRWTDESTSAATET